MRPLSERFLTIGYIAALGIIALLTLASHLTLNQVLQAHEGSAAVINVSGRQRMLSQRIASLAAQDLLGDATAKPELLMAIDRFEDMHHRLLTGDPALHLPSANSPTLQAAYFGGNPSLDQAARDFIANARQIVSLPPGDPAKLPVAAALFAAARAPLLTALDNVVAVHEQESNQQLARLRLIQNFVLIVVLVTLLVEAFAIFRPMVKRIMRYAGELMRLATTDPLTGALNRRSFRERALAEIDRARRHGRALSVLMIDADHFKKVNDTYGHGGGDAVLKTLVDTVHSLLRSSDSLGRFGGEEFAILLPDTDTISALPLAERIRSTLAETEVAFEQQVIRFTVSIGVAPLDPQNWDLQKALDHADLALYDAKTGGRNRVMVRDAASHLVIS